MKSLSSRTVIYGLLIVFCLLCALPNVLPASVSEKLPAWYSDTGLALGLDLRGGSHLLLEVDTRELLRNDMQQLASDLGDALRKERVSFRQPVIAGDSLQIAAGQTRDETQAMADLLRVTQSLKTLSDGVGQRFTVKQDHGQLTLTVTDLHREKLTSDAVERSLEVVRRRLDETGLVEPSITRQGVDGILVQMPGVTNPQEIRQLLGTTAKMSFHWVADGQSRHVFRLTDEAQGTVYELEERVAMEGRHIRDAQLAFNPDSGQPVVNFKLDREGAAQFGEMTRVNIGRPLAIVLDKKVITAPVIRSVIAGGSGEISGSFTSREASNLALLLRAGALPAPLKVIEERTVGPDLGSDAIAMGVSTGLLGALLVVGFMLIVYGRWGLIACVGLTVNLGLIFGILSLLGATLTLPGIAGIILSIGMAVDANILINERIREETRNGKSAFSAMSLGFDRAYSTILDSNVTTLIAVSLLFLFGNGPVKGFAVTIGIGLLTSMFTAIAVTRLLMEWRVRRMGRRPLAISGIRLLDRLTSDSLDLMRGRVMGLMLSLVLSLGSLALFFGPGLEYGIDFTGGTLVEVQAPDTRVEDLRSSLLEHGLGQAAIQETSDAGHYLVRLPMQDAEQVATGEPVEALKAAVLAHTAEATFPRVEMVGPKVSGDFVEASIMAVLLAAAGMLVYLWMRFEYHFALAATITIALDLTKTIGFFVLAGVEFNLTAVAALLALIGYSINDKVVVFDRVRENLRLTPDKPLLELLNESITSTLTRTVFTSLTTFLALLPMAIAGGAAVASFALPMLFGIVVGTSSSVLIAAPILFYLGQRRMRSGAGQLRPSAEQLRKELDLIP